MGAFKTGEAIVKGVKSYADEGLSALRGLLGGTTEERLARAAEQGYDTGRVFYHGSGADIQEFDSLKIGTATDSGWFGKGFYFSPDSSIANQYAALGAPNVTPVYLKVNNPYDWRKMEGRGLGNVSDEIGYNKTREILDQGHDAVDVYDDIVRLGPDEKLTDEQWKAIAGHLYKKGESSFLNRDMVERGMRAGMHDLGYYKKYYGDEIADMLPVQRTLRERVVFDPSNIRSVNADFNPANASSPNLLAGLTGAAVIGSALAPEEAEAGMLDVGLRTVAKPVSSALRTMAGERALERGAREVMTSTAALSAAEKAAVRAAWEQSGIGTLSAAMESARNIKSRFPTKGVNTPWSPFSIQGMDIVADAKTGAISYSPKVSKQAYAFHIDPVTGKEATRESQYFNNMVDGVANEIIAVKRLADNGDPAAKRIMDNAGWYKNVEARGFNEYGSFFDTFGDLLGATSPNTPVKTNFNFSRDILERASRGDFDAQIDSFANIMDQVDSLTAANNAMEEAARSTKGSTIKAAKASPEYRANLTKIEELKGQVEQIRQESGKLYGINSTNAMVALSDRWRIFRKGDAPKAKNFSGNLVGYSLAPTIDVWSARNLRRHSGRAPIPSPGEKGVTGEIIDPVKFTNSQEFGFGQDVLTAATDRVNQALGMKLDPRDMQALQWFVEKDLWSKNGWTTAAGEGGSFETMMDALPTESLAVGTSRAQSMQYQGRDFIPGPKDQLEVAKRFLDDAATDPDVIAAKAPTTLGLYGDAPEIAFDVDIVSNRDAVPVSTLDQVARQAAEDSQDSFFVARRVRPQVGEARPELFQTGVEAYFTKPVAPDSSEINDLYKHLQGRGVQGFTLIVDPRKKPGAMADQVIGVRFLDIPQFYDAENFANMSDAAYRQHVLSKQDEYRQIGDELKSTFGNIRTADPAFFDVNVKSKGSAADYVAQLSNPERDRDVLHQEMWGFKPARTRFKEYAGQARPYYYPSGAGTRATQSGFASPALLGATAATVAGGLAAGQAFAPDQLNPIQIGSPRPQEHIPRPSPVLSAVNDFARRQNSKFAKWDDMKRKALEFASGAMDVMAQGDAIVRPAMPYVNAALEAIDMPMKGYYGLTTAVSQLASGAGLDQALQQGARVSQQPIDVTADEYAGPLADRGYPGTATALRTIMNVTGPI